MFTDHVVQTSQKLGGTAAKAVSSQLSKWLIERRGLQREISRVGAVSPVDLQELAALKP